MAAQPGRFRFRRPVAVRPVMLRAGLALAISMLVLVALKAKAGAHADGELSTAAASMDTIERIGAAD